MKIAFIATTFLRDELLYKSVQSLLDNYFEGMTIIIVDQGHQTQEKTSWVFNSPHCVNYYQVPFDSGLSYGRNFGVEKAKELGCEYTLIASDSFLFNKTMKELDKVVDILNNTKYSLCGLELIPSVCGWEAKLNLIEGKHFELNFIDKSLVGVIGTKIPTWEIDICRNIFLAKTESLLDTKWDEDLKLGEHEDFFWRYKQNGYNCLWTNYIYANKITDRPTEYAKYRKLHFNDGLTKLRKKYNLSGWVDYINLDRAKNYQKYSQHLDKQ